MPRRRFFFVGLFKKGIRFAVEANAIGLGWLMLLFPIAIPLIVHGQIRCAFVTGNNEHGRSNCFAVEPTMALPDRGRSE